MNKLRLTFFLLIGLCILVPQLFAADILPADSTVAKGLPIQAKHINSLRAAINQRLTDCSLTTITWTDDPLVARSTPIKKIHMDELRGAVVTLVTAAQRANNRPTSALPEYTDPYIREKVTLIKAAHVEELRTVVNNYSCGGITSTPAPELCWSMDEAYRITWDANQCAAANVGSCPTLGQRKSGNKCYNKDILAFDYVGGSIAVSHSECRPVSDGKCNQTKIVKCDPNILYTSEAACVADQGSPCEIKSTAVVTAWAFTMAGGSVVGCAARNSGCGSTGFIYRTPAGGCTDPTQVGATTSYGCGCDGDGTFLRAYYECKISKVSSWSCI